MFLRLLLIHHHVCTLTRPKLRGGIYGTTMGSEEKAEHA